MNLRHLLFFTTAVDCNGVSRAAERLRVSQPAVSAGLKALEDELGHRLFERTSGGRQSRTTDKGQQFYHHAVDILRRCDAAKRLLSEVSAAPMTIRIGVLRTISTTRISAVADSLEREATDWRWRLREGSVNQLLGWLRRGRVDAVWSLVDDNIAHSLLLWQERYTALVSRDHVLARRPGTAITVADLAGEKVVLRSACEMRPGALQSAGLALHVAAVAHRDDLALALVARGLGVAIGPASYASTEIVALQISELTEARSIGIRWRPDLPEPVLAALLRSMDCLRSLSG